MSKTGMVYLIPSTLHDEGTEVLPAYILQAVKKCTTLFVENERTSRRFLKKLFPAIKIEDYEWHSIHKAEKEVLNNFRQKLKEGKTIGIISEAGCPGIADPGQLLVAMAHEMNADVKPLVGPSSVILALMASGLNGQHFRFAGYLPIETHKRNAAIKDLESESGKKQMTQIFIETPYRNNQLFEALLKICINTTQLCIAIDLTSPSENIKTKKIAEWKKNKPDLHKKQVIFCLLA